jgi:hypothetical protein
MREADAVDASLRGGERDAADLPGHAERTWDPMAGAMRAELRDFAYRGVRFPADARRDSERAVLTHPRIVLLPACFGAVEREPTGWEPALALQPTAHDTRRVLDDAMAEMWPMPYRFDEATKALHAKAAEGFRICRVGRPGRTGRSRRARPTWTSTGP